MCGGSYSIACGRLTAGPLACTRVACPMNRGPEFASLIDGSSEIEIEDDGELEIESAEGTVVLRR